MCVPVGGGGGGGAEGYDFRAVFVSNRVRFAHSDLKLGMVFRET